MSKKSEAKKEFKDLVEEGQNLLQEFIAGDEKNMFRWDYQEWYSKATPAVKLLASDRLDEFKKYYEVDPKRKKMSYGTYVIQDFFKGVVPSSIHGFDANEQVKICFYNQLTMLKGLSTRIDSVLTELEEEIYAEIKDSEINTAKSLLKVSLRAAGALSGVVLEGYLSKLCRAHEIKFRKASPTISDFNEALKKENIYKTPTWRKISYLADIRNICCHSKEEKPTRDQVEELINGTEWVVKNIF